MRNTVTAQIMTTTVTTATKMHNYITATIMITITAATMRDINTLCYKRSMHTAPSYLSVTV